VIRVLQASSVCSACPGRTVLVEGIAWDRARRTASWGRKASKHMIG